MEIFWTKTSILWKEVQVFSCLTGRFYTWLFHCSLSYLPFQHLQVDSGPRELLEELQALHLQHEQTCFRSERDLRSCEVRYNLSDYKQSPEKSIRLQRDLFHFYSLHPQFTHMTFIIYTPHQTCFSFLL